jgi:hypothetical protein
MAWLAYSPTCLNPRAGHGMGASRWAQAEPKRFTSDARDGV